MDKQPVIKPENKPEKAEKKTEKKAENKIENKPKKPNKPNKPNKPAWRQRLELAFSVLLYLAIGVGVCWLTYRFSDGMELFERGIAIFTTTSLGVMVSMLLLTPLLNAVSGFFRDLINHLFRMPLPDIFSGVLGLIVGLVIACLLNTVVGKIQVIGPYISVVSLLFFSYIGMVVMYRKREDVAAMLNWRGSGGKAAEPEGWLALAKVVDTSALIDGRLADICRSGFLEGKLVVAGFVLDEMRHMADLADVLKRNRGRRGLDILNRLQKELPGKVELVDRDFPEVAEVDNKLLRLAQEIGGAVLTTDYNLGKVAMVQDVPILNVNELANALRAVWLPGEVISVQVVQPGKEANQGLAYLEDGTMIVVENGRQCIGCRVDAEVSSVLQTAAGRMIFARVREAQ